MRFGEPHHDVGAAFGAAVPLAEHGVALADAGRGSEVDPQVPASRPAAGVALRAGAYAAVVLSHVGHCGSVSSCAFLAVALLAAAPIHCEAQG